MMSEAFWDAETKLKLNLNQDPLPNFRSITGKTAAGFIQVPGIGGGTANTEFEVLTGFTKRFINDYNTPYNPYNSYVYRPIRSLATIFSELGYQATAIHPYHSWFYRRNEVYRHLGFHRFLPIETFSHEPKQNGPFVADHVANALIFEEMEKSQEWDFIHVVTMEGHGPYSDLALEQTPIEVKNDLSSTTKETVEN